MWLTGCRSLAGIQNRGRDRGLFEQAVGVAQCLQRRLAVSAAALPVSPSRIGCDHADDSGHLYEEALGLLRRAVGHRPVPPGAVGGDPGHRGTAARLLVVQRTGWGKSAVYFVATRLLRDRGSGPTVIVSPLIALMRNQVEMADRLGLVSRTVNSTNREEWDPIFDGHR